MPIKIGKKTYKNFDAAVRAVMSAKKFTEKQARAYVATIERKQKGK